MGTEEDKTNNGVLITLFVMGAAAMLGGSAAIVGMTRTEMEAQSQDASSSADLDAVRNLIAAQRKELADSKLPIAEARAQMLADIQRNPVNASWATPAPTDTSAAAAGTGGGAGVGGGLQMGGAANDAAGGAANDAPGNEAAGGGAPKSPGDATTPAPTTPAPTTPAPAPTTPASSAPSPKTPPQEEDPKPAPPGKTPAVPTSAPAPRPAPAPSE